MVMMALLVFEDSTEVCYLFSLLSHDAPLIAVRPPARGLGPRLPRGILALGLERPFQKHTQPPREGRGTASSCPAMYDS